MTRQEAIGRIVDYAHPLAPEDTVEENEERFRQWLARVDPSWLDVFLDTFANPTENILQLLFQYCPEDVEITMSECLKASALNDPAQFRDKVIPYLKYQNARIPILYGLRHIPSPRTVEVLDNLLQNEELNPEELVYVQHVLRMIGTPEALHLYDRLISEEVIDYIVEQDPGQLGYMQDRLRAIGTPEAQRMLDKSIKHSQARWPEYFGHSDEP